MFKFLLLAIFMSVPIAAMDNTTLQDATDLVTTTTSSRVTRK